MQSLRCTNVPGIYEVLNFVMDGLYALCLNCDTVWTLHNVFVNILDTVDAIHYFQIHVALVFCDQHRVVWHYPFVLQSRVLVGY